MSRANTDQIIAHVDLLRSLDRLLREAEAVRRKRAALDKLLASSAEKPCPADTDLSTGGRTNAV
jgi:hypothetical protein